VGVCTEITFGVIVRDMSEVAADLDMTEGLDEAILKAGSQAALAGMLGVRQSHISNWKNRNKRVPAERVLEIERVTGVPRHKLRPDLYPCDSQ
jgi:DNA-binding transcriptional regulator YdaS (Cro superfamily)